MAQEASSAELIRDTVRNERDAQLRHADALDAKAGVVVGLSGVVVAVAAARADGFLIPGLVAAALSALLALIAFVPRKWPTWDLHGLRDRYLAADPVFTTRKIVDGEIAMASRQRDRLSATAALLKCSIGALVLAILLILGGTIVSDFGG